MLLLGQDFATSVSSVSLELKTKPNIQYLLKNISFCVLSVVLHLFLRIAFESVAILLLVP